MQKFADISIKTTTKVIKVILALPVTTVSSIQPLISRKCDTFGHNNQWLGVSFQNNNWAAWSLSLGPMYQNSGFAYELEKKKYFIVLVKVVLILSKTLFKSSEIKIFNVFPSLFANPGFWYMLLFEKRTNVYGFWASKLKHRGPSNKLQAAQLLFWKLSSLH